MELLTQRVFDGLGTGAIYGAMALAVVLVWRSTGTINMAQAAMGMFSAFVAWKLSVGLGWPLPLAVLAAILVGMLAGAVIERVIIRPVEQEVSHLPIIIVTLGLGLIISAFAGKFFTLRAVSMPAVLPQGTFSVGSAAVSWETVSLVAILLIAALGIWLLFNQTRIGLHMRAAVDNPVSSQLVGIKRSQMLMMGWGLAGGLGALAAIMIAPMTFVHTTMLDGVLFYSFAAAILGGLESAMGAVIGGLLLGVFESLVVGYVDFIGGDLSLLTAFTVIVLVLLVKPTGMFGREEMERV